LFFFDMVFVELLLGFFGANGTSRIIPMKEEIIIDLTKKEVDVSYGGLDIGFLGKFPFTAGEVLTVFPLLGIQYRSILLFKNKTGNYKDYDPLVFSALWFKFGGGMDYSINDSIFLRGQVMYGVRLPNKIEKYLVSGSDKIGISFYDIPALLNIDTRRGHGLSVKFAVGFRL